MFANNERRLDKEKHNEEHIGFIMNLPYPFVNAGYSEYPW